MSQNSSYPDFPFTKLYLVAAEGDNIYTAGSCDALLVSDNGGTSWETIERSLYGLEEIQVVPNTNGEKAFFLYRSKILVLDMATKIFEDIADDNLNSMSDNFKILFVKDNMIYIVDDAGLFRAEIGTYQWEKYMGFTLTDEFIMRADVTESYLWLGTSTGNIIRVNLTDRTQTTVHQFERRVYTVEMVDDNTGYFTYQTGSKIFKTIDSGASFFPVDGMPETSDPVALGKDLLLTINTNRFYVSRDGGVSSQYIGMPKDGLTSLVSGYALYSDTTLYLVGESAMILKSEDLGQTFENLNPFYRENLQSIAFNTSGEAYAVGGNYNVVHSTDSGQSWNFTDWGEGGNNFYQSVVAAGAQRFLVGSDDGILTIENNTITRTFPGSCYLLYDSPVSNDIYALRYDAGLVLSKTTDQGDTWTDLSSLSNNAYHLHQTTTGRLFTMDSNRNLIFSDDEGQNWESLPLQGFSGSVSTFFFLDNDNGIISSGNKLFRTTDGGNTAIEIASNYAISNLYMFSLDHYIYTYATNDLTSIQETMDGGQSWQNTGMFCSPSYGFHFDGEETVWYAQKGGHINQHTILKTSGVSTGSNTPESLTLFPNPVRQDQGISLSPVVSQPARVILYDLTGRVVSMQRLNPGSEKVSTGELRPGSYLIELIHENGIRQHGKFIVYQ
jgi:photosystem II stability/assembly factor-like uncharacterized protein